MANPVEVNGQPTDSPQSHWTNYLEFAAETHIGMRRANNQDSHAVVYATSESQWRERGHFFIVADGMGAHAAGELASKMAVDGVPHRYHKSPEASAPEALVHAILETNAEIFRRGHENNEFLHMGTTASMLALLPQGALIAHIGDSRVYRLRENKFEQLTFDHSLVWELKAAGQLGENSELANVVPKNVITRSLGPNATVQVDLEGPMAVEAGDVYLLCSDGLTGRIENEELAGVLANYRPAEAAKVLIDLANLRGGQDNITLIVAKVLADANGAHPDPVKPIRIGQREPAMAMTHGVWIATAVFALMFLVFFLTENWFLASVAVCGCALSFGWLKWYRSHLNSGSVSLGEDRKLGKAPYTTTSCPSRSQFMKSLTDILNDVRANAEESNWVRSWPPLNFAGVSDAVRNNQNEGALSQFSEILHQMMAEVWRQLNKKSNDSSIRL